MQVQISRLDRNSTFTLSLEDLPERIRCSTTPVFSDQQPDVVAGFVNLTAAHKSVAGGGYTSSIIRLAPMQRN